MTLVEFLRARLDEDEQAAKAAPDAPWYAPERDPANVYLSGSGAGPILHGYRAAVAGHAARHDPARVLAEVDAKRRIVDLHAGKLVEGRNQDGDERESYFCVADDDEMPCETLRLLGLPDAGHPDYRPEWRP